MKGTKLRMMTYVTCVSEDSEQKQKQETQTGNTEKQKQKQRNRNRNSGVLYAHRETATETVKLGDTRKMKGARREGGQGG